MKELTRQEMIDKIKLILAPEKSFYIISLIYSAGVSVLSLGVPLSLQALVNSVSFNIVLQPLIVLSIVLFSFLVFSGVLNALTVLVLELFQQHFYARVTSTFAVKVTNSKVKELIEKNGVDLVYRYFDIKTIQKNLTTLLIEGLAIILQTVVGLILLTFYHPYFIGFNVILVISLWLVWKIFRKKAITTAIMESKVKYQVASWLKEQARANLFFKSRKRKEIALKKSDKLIEKYLTYRRTHFRQVFYQTIFLLSLYAVLSSLVLGLGGYLVMRGLLTLGQLVAAELVVTVILSNFAKSGKLLESFYDFYAAIDKVSQIYDLPAEENNDIKEKSFSNYDFKFKEVVANNFGRNFEFDFDFQQGHNYFIRAENYSCKKTLIDLSQKLIPNSRGVITFGEYLIDEISALDLRDHIYVVDQPSFFEGSMYENLVAGDENITKNLIFDALKKVELDHIPETFKDGIDTKIFPSGYPLWSSQLIRLELARVILLNPKVIIITEVIDQLEPERRERVLNYFTSIDSTLIVFSNKQPAGCKYSQYIVIDENLKTSKFENENQLREHL